MSARQVIRGKILVPGDARGEFQLLREGEIVIDSQGRIESVGPAHVGTHDPETRPGCVWIPGLIDTHVHFPQTRAIGRSSGTLLKWLEKTIFAEEAKFEDVSYAREVAREFCRTLVVNGTTCASIYGSSHEAATQVLFEELDRSGLRAHAGMTLMDRGAPPELCREASVALAGCERLIQRWDGHDAGRLRFCITPRFALSCTSELMKGAAALADRFRLPVQTHLSENRDELAAVRAEFPEHASYLQVYEAHGLCHERSLFAHSLWLEDAEWNHLAESKAAISHCPDSNFFLRSGRFSFEKAASRKIPVGLGSDVGAGRSFSMRRVANRAYDMGAVSGTTYTAGELLWLATVGGAEAMGLQSRVGTLRAGFDADLVAIECPAADEPGATLEEILDAVVFNVDSTPVRSTWVRGRELSVG